MRVKRECSEERSVINEPKVGSYDHRFTKLTQYWGPSRAVLGIIIKSVRAEPLRANSSWGSCILCAPPESVAKMGWLNKERIDPLLLAARFQFYLALANILGN